MDGSVHTFCVLRQPKCCWHAFSKTPVPMMGQVPSVEADARWLGASQGERLAVVIADDVAVLAELHVRVIDGCIGDIRIWPFSSVSAAHHFGSDRRRADMAGPAALPRPVAIDPKRSWLRGGFAAAKLPV